MEGRQDLFGMVPVLDHSSQVDGVFLVSDTSDAVYSCEATLVCRCFHVVGLETVLVSLHSFVFPGHT